MFDVCHFDVGSKSVFQMYQTVSQDSGLVFDHIRLVIADCSQFLIASVITSHGSTIVI